MVPHSLWLGFRVEAIFLWECACRELTGGSQLVTGWLVAQLLSCCLRSQELDTCRCGILLCGCGVLRSFVLAYPMEFMASAMGQASSSHFRHPPGLSSPQRVAHAQVFVSTRTSPSKSRRDLARAVARRRWLESKAEPKTAEIDSGKELDSAGLGVWFGMLERTLTRLVNTGDDPFAAYFAKWSQCIPPCSGGPRQREIFPISPVQEWIFESLEICSDALQLLLLNACIASLNFLAADFHLERCVRKTSRKHSKLQASVVQRLAGRISLFLRSVSEMAPDHPPGLQGFAEFEGKPTNQYPNLNAAAVDLPQVAGACDPSFLIPQDLHFAASSPSFLFQNEELQQGEIFSPWGQA